MKLKNLRWPKIPPTLARHIPTHRDFARSVADFLNHDIARQGWNLPEEITRTVPGSNPKTSAGRGNIRKSHVRLKALVIPALDAFAEGRTGASEFEDLILAFNGLRGNAYRFERRVVNGKLSDEWERNPNRHIDVNSLYEFYLARLAELFDAGKLDLLAVCRHCGRFFVTAGRGKPAMYAPGHRNDVTNQKLRDQGYFQKRYKESVKEGIKAAQRYSQRGLRGKALVAQLRKDGFPIGKTLLMRNQLWAEGD